MHYRYDIVRQPPEEPPDEPSERWINSYPAFSPYVHEACGLGEYMTKRESGRLKHQFTINVIKNNVIIKDPVWCDLQRFKDLVKMMHETGYLDKKSSSSYVFTGLGVQWYTDIKKDGFRSS